MENGFSVNPLIWSGLAAACLLLPLLIHLIQLYRHQKRPWAAMTFLIRAQKKSRRWIQLKQWLLIASRIAILLLGLITLSQLRCNESSFRDYLGQGNVTQHILLIDDSYSMEAHSTSGTARQKMLDAIEQLTSQLAGKPNQRLSLMTFSRAEQVGTQPETSQDNALPTAALRDEVLTPDLNEQLTRTLGALPASYSAAGPQAAVEWAVATAQKDLSQTCVIHLFSDFRGPAWMPDQNVWDTWKSGSARSLQWNLVDCGTRQETESPLNLSLEFMESIGNLNTTRTGFLVNVGVRNHGDRSARNVVVQLQSWQHPLDAQLLSNSETILAGEAAKQNWQGRELPALLFEEIGPGELAQQTFSVSFAQPGWPVLLGQLPEDQVAADNIRQCSFPARSEISLLVIDDQISQGSWLLSQSLNPANMTGARCQIETSAALRRLGPNDLRSFKAIVLLDVPRLDEAAIGLLKQFVADGGGLLWFAGPQADPLFYNRELYQAGLFPVTLDRVVKTPERLETEAADLLVTPHPIFQPFLDDDRSQLEAVVFQWIWKTDLPDVPPSTMTRPTSLASFRGKSEWPLFLEHQLSDVPESGRILTFLSTCDGQWNNWPQELTFPAQVLLATDYVARRNPTTELDLNQTQWVTASSIASVTARPSSLLSSGNISAPTMGKSSSLNPGTEPGIWHWQSRPGDWYEGDALSRVDPARIQGPIPLVWDVTTEQDQGTEHRRWTSNVDTSESRLIRTDPDSITALAAEGIQIMKWNQLQWQAGSLASLAWLRPWIIGLGLLMLVEALTAWWTTQS